MAEVGSVFRVTRLDLRRRRVDSALMTLGERFATAVAARDAEELRGLLAANVDFKGLTPRRFWEASTPDEVLEIVLGNWFGEQDRIDGVAAIEDGEDVGDVRRVGYRFEVTTPDGPHVVEQQAYYYEHENRLLYLRVVCSGFRPVSD